MSVLSLTGLLKSPRAKPAADARNGTTRVVPATSRNESPTGQAAERAAEESRAPSAASHAVIASRWSAGSSPAQTAFRAWTERYFATRPGTGRDALVAEGVLLAADRRSAMARLIVADPEAALASAVPMAIREALPERITEMLERRVSARGELALNAVTPAPDRPLPEDTVFHSALIEGREYRAYVYGRRARQATIADSAISGIAVDELLAVAESPARLLEPGETPSNSAQPVSTCVACAALADTASSARILYEYAGRLGAAPTKEHFLADLAVLEAAERDLTEADNRPGSSTVIGRPTKAWAHGVKKVLLIRVDFPDKPGTPTSGQTVLNEVDAVDLFSQSGGVGDFYLASSFGQTSLGLRPADGGDSPDVTPVLRLSRNALDYAVSGESVKLHDDARAAAEKAGYDLAAYDRIGVVFSSLRDLVDGATGAKSKITYGGLANVIGRNFWVNGAYSFRVVAHEIGHTYGLRHANLWKVTDGDPVSENGRSLEYGDPFDLMGGGEDFSASEDFGPWNKSLLQWIPDASVTVAKTGGVYRVHRIDGAGADLGLPRAVKISRDPTRDYWIGYRRDTDNAFLDGGAYVMWGYNANRPGDLLDLSTPGADPADAALPLGSAFDDHAAAITLKPVAQGGDGADEWIDLEISIGRRVQWVSSSVLASEQGGSVTLVLRRTGEISGDISVAYATEDATATAGADYSAASGIVSWGEGDMADKTISITLAPDGEAELSESFRVRLGTVTGGVSVGPAAAAVTIAEVGAADDSFRSDFIGSTLNRMLPLPNGAVLVGGNFTQLQDSAGAIFSGIGRIARFNGSGSFDPDFSAGAGANAQIRCFAAQADGRVLVGGDFTSFAGQPAGRIVRLFPDGSLDSSFKAGAGANEDVHDLVVQPDGRILVVGAFTKFGAASRNRVARLNADGSVDPSFANPTFSATILRTVALQPDGKVLVGGGLSYSGLPGVGFKSGVARLNSNGTRDTTFDVGHGAHTAGATNTLTSVFRLAVQPDGRILVVGSFTGFGGLGGSPRQFLARLSASGAVDPAFGPRFSFPATVPAEHRIIPALRTLPGNRILVGGNFSAVNSVECSRYALLDENGSPDAAFAEAGGLNGRVLDLAILPDGKGLLAGDPAAFQGSGRQRPLWRFIPGLTGAPGSIGFSADAYDGREGNTVTLTVARSGGSLGPATVAYAAARAHASDTATANADYSLAAGLLTWADGDASERLITIPLHNDTVDDDGEVFTVRLGDPVLGGASLGENREALVTIKAFHARAQTIDFAPLKDGVLGDAPRTLLATASSGRHVGFELVSGPAILSGATLAPTGPGQITVRAVQIGDVDFDPAPAIERSFTVRAPATVTLGNLSQPYAAAPRAITTTIEPAAAAVLVTYAGAMRPPRDAGEYPVRATVVDPLLVGTGAGILRITKAPLGVVPQNQRRLVGTDNAPIAFLYHGLLGDDTAADLDKLPVAKTAATKTSKPGDYPISLGGGSDNNYAFVPSPGVIRVVGFGGAYEVLLLSETDGKLAGKFDLTISAVGPGFTGTLNWMGEGAPLPVRGTLRLDGNVAFADSAIALGESSPAANGYKVKLIRVTGEGVQLEVFRGDTRIASGAGPRLFVPLANGSVAWRGPRTVWLTDLAATEGDVRPIPGGAGHAAFTVPPGGAFTLNAHLPDGSKFSASLRPDTNGVYRLFGRPYGTRSHSYFADEWDLNNAGARAFVWRKAGATGTTPDPTLRAGFAVEGVAQSSAWTPPKAATASAAALAWSDILGLDPLSGSFHFQAGGVDFAGADAGLPGNLALNAAGTVKPFPATTANPRRLTLVVTAKSGAASGSFVLADGRKVNFSASLRPAPAEFAEATDIGRGFFIVPPAVKGGEATSGDIRLTAPVQADGSP